jgi:hypothetical protein
MGSREGVQRRVRRARARFVRRRNALYSALSAYVNSSVWGGKRMDRGIEKGEERIRTVSRDRISRQIYNS